MTSALEKQRSLTVYVWLYLAVYGVCSALFLTGFPFVHSDEGWLAGLSRDMMAEGSLGVTESFFNAKVRYPHAIKSIYHLLQQAYIALFGYSPFAVRLLSLTGAIVFLWPFYLLAKRFTEKDGLSFALMILLSLHTWFIYISHFARQESWLLALMAGVMLALCPARKRDAADSDGPRMLNGSTMQTPAGRAFCAALLTGIAIGFHPNSFLLACVAGGILLAQLIQARPGRTQEADAVTEASAQPHAKKHFDFRSSPLAPPVLYVCVVALFAAFFIAVSYSFGPHFLRNYFAYGAADFGLDAPPGDRLTELFGFFARLWKRESGTYYLPETRVFFVLMLLLVIGMTVYAVRRKDRDVALLPAGLAGLIAGIYIIGRFNQMSFIFFFPFVYLLAGKALLLLPRREVFFACAFSIQLLTSVLQIRPWLLPPAVSSDRKAASDGTYDGYLRELEALVPRDAKTIANLNTAFYFDQGKLLDYRNLPYVMQGESNADAGPDADAPDPAGGATASPVSRIAAYVEENHVEYILYTVELDYLLSHRPYYNVIYGNIMFAEALKEYCETRCKAVGSFTDARYGARVIALMGDERYGTVTVYRVVE
ncbi:MAG: hypothetical protein IJR00_00375 [Lachnospiraceae bacterium]|nr:hypothetical protein [Lachnospiraceae bacterium]